MPRGYVPKLRPFDAEKEKRMVEAVNVVKLKEMSLRKVADTYKLSKTATQRRLS